MQELLGHSDVSTTMIYTHVLNRGGRAVKSPLELRNKDKQQAAVNIKEPPDEGRRR